MNVPIITIDGPSGTGKGTLTWYLAEKLSWHALDSGAIYRSLAFGMQLNDITSPLDTINLCKNMNLEFRYSKKSQQIFYDNIDITNKIRSEHCGGIASKIAIDPKIRAALLETQRKFAKAPGLVADGRDMGTVVFPDAKLKIFLTAQPAERAKRRFKQLQGLKNSVSLGQVEDELNIRDERDKNRESSPLKPAVDAICLDTTKKSIMQVGYFVLKLAQERFDLSLKNIGGEN